jgi:DNA-3-methyladenine glycosylase
MDILSLLSEDPVAAAPHLLGWTLVKGEMKARLVEVEAYRTPDDPGCHAHRGLTKRCATMFARPGVAYVYFTYGNHWMINVAAFPKGRAAAILLRAAEPLEGIPAMELNRPKARHPQDLLSGPGKLTAAFGITGADDGIDLFDQDSPLRLEPGKPLGPAVTGTRIGLAPGKGDELPWRFVDQGSLRWCSRPLP